MMLLAQIVGFVGILLAVAIYQVNDRRTILYLQIATCIVWAIYYAMMSSYTAMGLIAIGAIRSFLFDKYRSHEWLLQASIVTYGIATLITWKDWTSIMAFMGMTVATIALWQKKPQSIRSVSLFVAPFWLTYNILNGSYMGVAGDLINFSSVVIGIVRFDMRAYLRRRTAQKETAELVDTNLV